MRSDHITMLRNTLDIRKLISKGILMLALIIWVSSTAEDTLISKDPLLHSAFSLLEEENPFQQRYNRIAGDEVQSRLLSFCLFFGRGFTFSFQAVSFFDVDRLVARSVHPYSM